ncbi:LicD family protein [Pareuzebyella sediminis]|uniref:LicD family protein n=1 Tax=Pareuzebyella sediminis TaxID=2607998 RepID=UPI0011F02D58|nr:LicD family protein [Pareuzebyella sediminis]
MTKLEEFQQELLVLLKQMDAICDKHGINYSLFGGTMIGAIRHNGFIPWDDDADVVFERVEYEKFLKVLPENLIVFRKSWVQRFSHKDNPNIYLDIFVFDVAPKSKITQKMQRLGLKAMQGTIKKKVTTKRGFIGATVSLFTYIIGLLFTHNFKLRVYDSIARIFKNRPTGYIFSSLDQFKYIGHVLPRDVVISYKKVDFENTSLKIMTGYDAYLKQFYGDYMKLPPKEMQKPVHGNLARFD